MISSILFSVHFIIFESQKTSYCINILNIVMLKNKKECPLKNNGPPAIILLFSTLLKLKKNYYSIFFWLQKVIFIIIESINHQSIELVISVR